MIRIEAVGVTVMVKRLAVLLILLGIGSGIGVMTYATMHPIPAHAGCSGC